MAAAIRLFVALFFSCSSAAAFAQMVVQASNASLQPQIGRDEGGFSSCGVRAVVLTDNKDYIDGYDFSLMIYADMMNGTLKAGKLRTRTADAQKGRYSLDAVEPGPVRFWIAQENEGKAITPIKTLPAETKGFILGVSDLAETFKGIMAIIHGERMQFAVRYKNQPMDLVVSFSSSMPDVERTPLLNCMNGVIERLSKLAEGESK